MSFATNATWSAWQNTITYTTDTSTATTWQVWTDTGTSTATTSLTWDLWAGQAVPHARLASRPRSIHDQYGMTPHWTEEGRAQWRAEDVAAAQAAEAQRAERARQEAAANEKARRLLVRHLGPTQRRTYRDARYFDVLVGKGKGRRRYRIREGWSGNVELIGPDGRALRRYCIHPREQVPTGDHLLGQLLMLRTEEEQFARVANVHVLRAA